jgi:hypothetical protein
VRFVIEVLHIGEAQAPRVLHMFTHTASSIHMVQVAMKSVLCSAEWPTEANGFRIRTDTGEELYRWPE